MTQIISEPNFVSICTSLLELKENASSVPCALGGGTQGYLGIILQALTHNTIEYGVPFDIPTSTSTITEETGSN